MIHSMSGGVIKDAPTYTFAKVIFDGDDERRPYWYISDFALDEGDVVIAPFGKADMPRSGVVVQVERCGGQVTPIPPRTAKRLIAKRITDDDDT